MYLIAGLGNPGSQYDMTRHNIGFAAIDYIANENNVKVKKLKYKAFFGELNVNGEKVLLVKPQTYMNLSGESIRDFCTFYKIPPEKVIILCDDIAIEPGKIRIRRKGSAGGHNGLKSIIYQLTSEDFIRIRIGVGNPQHKDYDLADYVLGRFGKDEIPVLEDAIKKSYMAAFEIIKNNVDSAMNKYNG